jgi:hypothetical protein
MKEDSAFVSIDYDDVIVIDMDESYHTDFVMIDEGYEDMDFITLVDDAGITSDMGIIDVDVFSGMDDTDISFIV